MRKTLSLLFFFCVHNASADPNALWFTGPLLAQPATTVEPGKVNLVFFNFNLHSNAIYNNQSKIVPVSSNINNQVIPQVIVGVAPKIDIELQPALISNSIQNKSNTSLGDTTVILGMQALEQRENSRRPDLRITLSEILPSGHYERLSEQNYALNATGLGSYQTGLDFNFQKLIPLRHDYYLNAHLNFGYLYATTVHINGLSSYGGSALTNGEVKPGSVFTLDLAGELSLSQHWVAVFEGFYQYQDSDRFFGDYGNLDHHFPKGTKKEIKAALSRLMPTRRNISSLFLDIPKVGNATMHMFSLAPALEYNFSKEFGIILGSWFSLNGKNTVDFGSFSMGINLFL